MLSRSAPRAPAPRAPAPRARSRLPSCLHRTTSLPRRCTLRTSRGPPRGPPWTPRRSHTHPSRTTSNRTPIRRLASSEAWPPRPRTRATRCEPERVRGDVVRSPADARGAPRGEGRRDRSPADTRRREGDERGETPTKVCGEAAPRRTDTSTRFRRGDRAIGNASCLSDLSARQNPYSDRSSADQFLRAKIALAILANRHRQAAHAGTCRGMRGSRIMACTLACRMLQAPSPTGVGERLT